MKLRTPTTLAALTVGAALLLGACGSSGTAEEASSTTSTPSSTQAASMQPTLLEIASANPEFSTLVAAVTAAGLTDALSGPGPVTVFAPTNAAFAALPAGTLDTLLLPENKSQLASILTYHVLPGTVLAADVQPGTVTTVNGAPLTVSVEGGQVFLTDAKGQKIQVVTTDIQGSNGVIHVINGVLLPA